MRNKFSLLLISLVILFTCNLLAQVPAAYQGSYNQMMRNASMNLANQNMRMMMNAHWYNNMDYLLNNTYDFNVTMKDSSVIVVRSSIYADTAKHKCYLILENKKLKRADPNRKEKIYCDATLKISRIEPKPESQISVYGFATDSCWLFKVITGKINVYSHLSEIDQLNNYYLRAFQVGNGPVQKIDSASLVTVIQSNPKAMKAFLKKDYYKAIQKFNDSK